MKNQPLWIDISSHQGEFQFAKIPDSGSEKVYGIISRAGVGLNKDIQFARNYEKSAGYYRSSYCKKNE